MNLSEITSEELQELIDEGKLNNATDEELDKIPNDIWEKIVCQSTWYSHWVISYHEFLEYLTKDTTSKKTIKNWKKRLQID